MLRSLFYIHGLPDVMISLVVACVQSIFARWLLAKSAGPAKSVVVVGWAASMALIGLGFLLRFARVARFFPRLFIELVLGSAMLWAFLSLVLIVSYALAQAVARSRPSHSPTRRALLRSVRWAILGAPMTAVGYGTFIQRFRLTLREQNILIPNLTRDLDGLRIAQLTDIHLSPYLSVAELERAVGMANEARPHLTLVTGDLITSEADPLDNCLRTLAGLRADAGVFGCMGNHEIYADSEAYTQSQGARLGINFLRQQARVLRFGTSDLNLAGVDYQRFGKPYLAGAEQLAVPGALNILLSHNPDVFPVAIKKGFPLTVAGHTHGGQVRVEILKKDLSIARIFTPYVDGLYQKEGASVFVSRGIGTINLPTRLGAPPEVALLKLCRT